MSDQLKSISLPNHQKDGSSKSYHGDLPYHTQSEEETHKEKMKLSPFEDKELNRATAAEVKQLPLSRTLISERDESLSDVSSSDIDEGSEDEEEVGKFKRCNQLNAVVIVPDACALQYGFQNTLKLVDFHSISGSEISDQEGCSSIAELRPKNYVHRKLKSSKCETESSSVDRKIQALLIKPEIDCDKGKILTWDSVTGKSTIGRECKEYAGNKKAVQRILQNLKTEVDPPQRQKFEAGDYRSIHHRCQRAQQKGHIRDDQGAQDRAKTAGSHDHDIINQCKNTSNVGRGTHQKSAGSQQKMKKNCSMRRENPAGRQEALVKPEAKKIHGQSNCSSNSPNTHPAREYRASIRLEAEVQNALTLTMKRWAEYLGQDNLQQEELVNALQYKYNDMALEMICAGDSSVWGLLHDMGQCPCLNC